MNIEEVGKTVPYVANQEWSICSTLGNVCRFFKVFVNTRDVNAGYIEATGNFLLGPIRYLFSGKDVERVDYTTFKTRCAHYDYNSSKNWEHYGTFDVFTFKPENSACECLKTAFKCILVAVFVITSPASILIGCVVKGLSFLFAEVREKHKFLEIRMRYPGYQKDAACDFSYADDARGFGYIASGTAPVLEDIFAKFNEQYEFWFDNGRHLTVDTEFVASQLLELGHEIHFGPIAALRARESKPAFGFAQVACVGKDARLLASFQFGNTMLLIQKKDGSWDTSLAASKANYGIGECSTREFHCSGNDTKEILENIQQAGSVTPVGVGDIIYGFSSGVSTSLPMDELQQIITATYKRYGLDTERLLEALKTKILQKNPQNDIGLFALPVH
jgi:hypothetical protein